MCRTALLMKERSFYGIVKPYCAAQTTLIHMDVDAFVLAVPSSEAFTVHTEPPGGRACFQVLFSSLPKLSTSSSSPPSLIQLCWVKRREQLWKDFISPEANLTFIPSLKWYCRKLALVWNDSGIILPTAVLEFQEQLSNKGARGSKVWLQFVKSVQ